MMTGNTYFALRNRSVTTEENKLKRNNQTKYKTNDECLPFDRKNVSVTKNVSYTGVAKELSNKQNKAQPNENGTIKASNESGLQPSHQLVWILTYQPLQPSPRMLHLCC